MRKLLLLLTGSETLILGARVLHIRYFALALCPFCAVDEPARFRAVQTGEQQKTVKKMTELEDARMSLL